jgi:hypothetical protein
VKFQRQQIDQVRVRSGCPFSHPSCRG